MFSIFRQLFTPRTESRAPIPVIEDFQTGKIIVDGLPILDFSEIVTRDNGLPYIDWEKVHLWASSNQEKYHDAWLTCEKAWLLLLKRALGDQYLLRETDGFLLLSSQNGRQAEITLGFLNRTRKRIQNLLQEIASESGEEAGKDIVILTDNEDDYYRYISHYYPEEGEFAFSSGMYLNHGCCHFVCMAEHLSDLEPIMIHEMTHSMTGHLALPLWLDEGIAVNVENRLAPAEYRKPPTPRYKHLDHWRPDNIQRFWNGEAFFDPSETHTLAYAMAQSLIEQLAQDWDNFKNFVIAAEQRDAGSAALKTHFGISLGELACQFMGATTPSHWEPGVSTEDENTA